MNRTTKQWGMNDKMLFACAHLVYIYRRCVRVIKNDFSFRDIVAAHAGYFYDGHDIDIESTTTTTTTIHFFPIFNYARTLYAKCSSTSPIKIRTNIIHSTSVGSRMPYQCHQSPNPMTMKSLTLISCVLFMLFCWAVGRRRWTHTGARASPIDHIEAIFIGWSAQQVDSQGWCTEYIDMGNSNDNGICLLHFQMSIKRTESFAKLCIEHTKHRTRFGR